MSSLDSGSTGGASQASAMAAKSGGSTASRAGRVRVGLDAAVVDAQKKWKRLTDISDDNSTAKDMAREVQSEFAALRQQRELQDLHRVHIPEEADEGVLETDQRELSAAKNVSNLDALFDRVQSPELTRLDRGPSGSINPMDKYVIAAAFIRDGIHGRKIGYRLDHTALFLHELFHSSSYRVVFTIVVAVSCALAFLERPGEQDAYLLVDLLCTCLFSIDVYIRWYMSSLETKRKFLSRQPWACVRVVLLLITFLDLGIHLSFPQWNPYRYSRALRPFFLIARRRNIRIIFGSCLRALREVLLVLLLSFCLVGFFGLLGYLLFSDISNVTSASYFSSLSSAMYTMLLIHNCLPYMVKSMYPYFQITQWSSLFFILFVLLTNLFLAKLTIAVSYKSYKKHTETMLYKRLQKRKAALYAAFDILATDVELAGEDQPDSTTERGFDLISKMERRGSSRFFSSTLSDTKQPSFRNSMAMFTPIMRRRISLETWLRVCEYLRPKWTSVESTLLFNTIDVEHMGYLDLSDFYQLCSLLSVKLERTQPSTAAAILRRCFPRLQRQTVRRWQLKLRGVLLYEKVFFGKYPVVIAELVVGALICLSVIQAVQVNNIELAFSVNRSWRIVGFVLLCLFTLEVIAKLFAFGRREFFGRPFCRLDLAIVSVGWTFYAITSMKDPPNVSLVFYDLALAVRSLRILKLLNLVPPFQEILWTMQRILPLICQLLLVILSFMYAFAIVTQANYGLALRTYPESLQSLSPSWYAVRYEFQVDTFAETLVTLFGVANLAGWDMVMDAAHAITQSNATYVFFFSYRIAMANVLLPIFVGFLVESFVSNAKTVESTIETYVESKMIGNEVATRPDECTIEDQKLALMECKAQEPFGQKATAAPTSPAIMGPLSSPASSDHAGFRMRFGRRGSMVQNEMFDAVRLSDMSRLKLMLEKKEEEVAQQDLEIRKLEGNVLGMQTRLQQSQHVILAYERKMEELNAQLLEAQRMLRLRAEQEDNSSALPSSSSSRPKSKNRGSSWRVWN
ncbi:hypothetical protein P43SY_009772 [Pythium insidiosum]|uniref:Ion transport domain-containing protein n=1 Tax=Pythium insidiosum TaxID=114742 RepID=A0AAD5Q9F9_PYTIN|nr:hypothetical protein P43SY_009772 [Pythium insidiosum]